VVVVSFNLSSSQIPVEDPLKEDDEEAKGEKEVKKEKKEEKEETSEKRSPEGAVDPNPQSVEEKKSSGCSLCNLL